MGDMDPSGHAECGRGSRKQVSQEVTLSQQLFLLREVSRGDIAGPTDASTAQRLQGETDLRANRWMPERGREPAASLH
jgi:hypothetical protein